MKNDSNIYDIDGEIIRTIEDKHPWSIEEAQKLIEKYLIKQAGLDKKDPKYIAYSTYIRNLNNYIMQQYAKMTPEQIHAALQHTTTEEQVNNALNELNEELAEPKSVAAEDLLVERDNVETVMDEYVSPIGEASDEYVSPIDE